MCACICSYSVHEFGKDGIKDVSTPSGLANILDLSPHSKEVVAKAVTKGVKNTMSSASPGEKRNFFMERVGIAYTPMIEKVLSTPTFKGMARPERVLQQVVHRLSAKRKGTTVVAGR